MATTSDYFPHKRARRWVAAMILAGIILPYVAYILVTIMGDLFGIKKIDMHAVVIFIEELELSRLADIVFSLLILAILSVSPYIYMAHDGYKWIVGALKNNTDSQKAEEYFGVLKWKFRGSVAAGLLLYSSFAYYGDESGSGDFLLFFPITLWAPVLLGGYCGFFIGLFVKGIRSDDSEWFGM